jgi:hypothetical protein
MSLVDAAPCHTQRVRVLGRALLTVYSNRIRIQQSRRCRQGVHNAGASFAVGRHMSYRLNTTTTTTRRALRIVGTRIGPPDPGLPVYGTSVQESNASPSNPSALTCSAGGEQQSVATPRHRRKRGFTRQSLK